MVHSKPIYKVIPIEENEFDDDMIRTASNEKQYKKAMKDMKA